VDQLGTYGELAGAEFRADGTETQENIGGGNLDGHIYWPRPERGSAGWPSEENRVISQQKLNFSPKWTRIGRKKTFAGRMSTRKIELE
jgi:hypothetical protein